MNDTKLLWVNDVSPNGLTSLRIGFDGGAFCSVDFSAYLGESVFREVFSTYSYFLNYRLDEHGGLTWPGGFSLSGAELKSIGESQRK